MARSREIAVNGVQLNDSAMRWRIEGSTPPRGRANRRHTSLVVPGRSGELPLPRETHDVAFYPLTLFITEYDEYGNPMGSAQTERNLAYLLGLMAGEFEIVETLSGPEELKQRAFGQLNDESQPARFPDLKTIQLVLMITITDGAWEQMDWSEETFVARQEEFRHVLRGLDETTAESPAAVIRVGPKGAGTIYFNTVDYNARKGVYTNTNGLSWTGSVAEDEFVFIDIDTFTAWRSKTATNWGNSSNSNNATSGLDYPSEGKFILQPTTRIPPGHSGTVLPVISARTNASSASVTIRAKGRYR